MKNLNELLKVLLTSDLKFVLIGGFAGVVHGSTRVTKDLDICLSMLPDELDRLREALRPFHPKHRQNPQNKVSLLEEPKSWDGWKNLYLETDLGILDIVGEVEGVGNFDRLNRAAMTIQIYEKPCKVISLDDLIQSKKALGRERDLLDVKDLMAIKNKKQG